MITSYLSRRSAWWLSCTEGHRHLLLHSLQQDRVQTDCQDVLQQQGQFSHFISVLICLQGVPELFIVGSKLHQSIGLTFIPTSSGQLLKEVILLIMLDFRFLFPLQIKTNFFN